MKKEHIGCIVTIILLIAFVGILFFFNGKNREAPEPKQEKAKTGEYVYIDAYHTLHNDIHCYAIGKEPGELGSADRGVIRIPVKSLTQEQMGKTCSRCISDADYEMLIESIGYYAE